MDRKKEYREAKNKIIYDVLSQLKELFPCNQNKIYYEDTQNKLYKIGKKYGLLKAFYKYAILDK